MTRPDASLQRLIDRLTSMADHDRTYVLDRLGPIGRDKLEPWLADSGLTSAPSSPLQALVRQVAGGQNPPSMTPKASAALRSLGPFAAGSSVEAARSPDGMARRVSDLLRKGVR